MLYKAIFVISSLFLVMSLVWKHPFSAIVAGPSGCGKTSFLIKFIDHAHTIVTPHPNRILWCYGIYQDVFNTMRNVEFHQGIPEAEELRRGTLLILDDLMHEADERVNKIFTKYSHHTGVSVIFLHRTFFTERHVL